MSHDLKQGLNFDFFKPNKHNRIEDVHKSF